MNRTRTDPDIISYGLYLYYFSSSRSFRLAATKCLSSSIVVRRSHVATIWKWLQRYSFLADNNNIRFRTDRHAVKEIFIVDETLVRMVDGGCDYWLWVAYV